MSHHRAPLPPDVERAPGRVSARISWALLACVVVVAAVAVAAAFVPAPHSGGDNAAYVTLAYSLVENGTYRDLYDPAAAPHTKYPPVFPSLLAVLVLLGVRTWSGLKMVAAASTVVAVGFSYLWARRRIGPTWAVGASLAVVFSSAVVYYSHWVLSDPTFMALTLASLWALEKADDEGAHGGWLVVGVVAAGVAYFTRSAGLPLLVALVSWLALRRRWRALALAGAAIFLPAAVWWMRARGVGDVQYVSEFWLVDPYDPGLGTVGIGGLLGRVVSNVGGYVGTHVPRGITGVGGGFGVVVGTLLFGLAAVGWWPRARHRPGPTELFLPLYTALILLWPVVWSGDRFALPLLPLLLVYAAAALKERAGAAMRGRAIALGALAVVLLPAANSWVGSAEEASACAAAVRRGGPFACYGQRMTQFAGAAGWVRDNLPEGSAVLTRKPRLFYVLSGVPSRTFPFDPRPEAHLRLADELGVRYVLLDQVDGLATRYVGGAVRAQPSAFCHVESFGAQGQASQLLGIRPTGERTEGGADPADGTVRIQRCGAEYVALSREGVGYSTSPRSTRIPLLDGLDP